jgi:5-(carboxyamino)imidazole ribonucleotide mutase
VRRVKDVTSPARRSPEVEEACASGTLGKVVRHSFGSGLARPVVKVSILVGSKSDLEMAEKVRSRLEALGIPSAVHVASAHRTPERVDALAKDPEVEVFVAIAGLSAALPGTVAARTLKPVVGLPLNRGLGLDSLLSIAQMPPGVPVATVGLDNAENAALLAAHILALKHPEIEERLRQYRAKWREDPSPEPRSAA